MTSLRVPPRRTGTPVTVPSPRPKPQITLEDWEAKTSLSEAEIVSIKSIQKASETRPLPLKNPPDLSRPHSPAYKEKGSELVPSRSGTPFEAALHSVGGRHNLLPKHAVHSPQQFYEWFSLIERSVAHSQESHYRAHLSKVVKHLDTCDDLLRTVDNVQSDVTGMLEAWRLVEDGGKSLKDASEQLLDERDRLINMAEDLSARLEYFQELEHATRMLNHPGEALVLQSDFLDMVERVDICIEFLRTHRHYREAEIYLLRFQQCMTRAMTLTRMYFVGSMKALTSDISRRMSEKELSQTAQMHLLYTRFQSISSQVAPLIGELERRSLAHPEELSSLLAECHSTYFQSRRTLLVGKLVEEIRGLDPGRTDLVELTSSGCSYLKQICIDEFALYKCFFNSGKEPLYEYLEGLCDHLYDDLRPRILHEPRLSVLCDVCKVLHALMVLDVPGADEDLEDERDEHGDQISAEQRKGLGRLHISQMLQSVLQDAQTRLFFKAQTVVQSEIRYYVAKKGDLDYPNKLIEASKNVANSPGIVENDNEDNTLFNLSSFGKRETWYPALKTTVSVLRQLHDFVQPTIFNDIATEAVDVCRLNLQTAALAITASDPTNAEIHSHLFLIRHLLVLKEIVNGLSLSGTESDGILGLRQMTDTLRDVLRSSSLAQYAFSSTLMKSNSENTGVGTKQSVDNDLRRACESAIEYYSTKAIAPLTAFMTSIDVTDDEKGQIPTQGKPLPSRETAIDVDNEFRTDLQVELPAASAMLGLYLEDNGTVSVLLSHIQEKIMDKYIAFRKATEFMPVSTDRTFESSSEDLQKLMKTMC